MHDKYFIEKLLYFGTKLLTFNFSVVSRKKSYIIKGEKFQSEISIGTYSSQINPSDIRLTVNGKLLEVGANGKAIFNQNASSTGKKTLKLTCAVTNPLTGEVKTGESTFEYEVGMRSATVSADKMNVFYELSTYTMTQHITKESTID